MFWYLIPSNSLVTLSPGVFRRGENAERSQSSLSRPPRSLRSLRHRESLQRHASKTDHNATDMPSSFSARSEYRAPARGISTLVNQCGTEGCRSPGNIPRQYGMVRYRSPRPAAHMPYGLPPAASSARTRESARASHLANIPLANASL